MGKTTFKLTESMKLQLQHLYEQGKTDTEIAEEFGVTHGAIHYWRKKLNLPTKFSYEKLAKFNYADFKADFEAGMHDSELASKYHLTVDGVYSHRMRHKLLRKINYAENPNIPLTERQIAILMGTLLGDSSLTSTGKHARLSCGHTDEQQDLIFKLAEEFSTLQFSVSCRDSKPDKRTGKVYRAWYFKTQANPAFDTFREAFYPKGKKVIPIHLLDKFTSLSLSWMFMDDGSKTSAGYVLCTNCFSVEELTQFQKFLKDKFNLDTILRKENMLYIRAKSVQTFNTLVEPHILPCMKYKLHSPCKTP